MSSKHISELLASAATACPGPVYEHPNHMKITQLAFSTVHTPHLLLQTLALSHAEEHGRHRLGCGAGATCSTSGRQAALFKTLTLGMLQIVQAGESI